MDSFDPLDRQGVDPEFLAKVKRREISNILKSYTGWYDPLSELIQNALDAVEQRKRSLTPGDDYIPRLWIEVNLKENRVSVTDNGIGFTEESFHSFMAPNVSFKKGPTRGNKGVGATYLAYGFNFIQVGTKHAGFEAVGEMVGGHDWVEDATGTVLRPMVKPSQCIHSAFGRVDQGATFTVKFGGEGVRPKDLDWVLATTAEQWDAILRIKTPLGIINREDVSVPTYSLDVVNNNGAVAHFDDRKCRYVYPHEVITSCKSLTSVLDVRNDLMAADKPTEPLPPAFRGLNGMYEWWSTEDLVQNRLHASLGPSEQDLVRRYRVCCYGFFCYSTTVWDQYSDRTLSLRKGQRVLKGGIQLATNSMPQGDLLTINLKKSIGYQNTTHVIVHFSNAEPDLGRKGFQPELNDLAQKLSIAAVKDFTNWRRLLKSDDGSLAEIERRRDAYDWRVEQDAYEKSHPLVISRKDVFLPMMQPSMTCIPQVEQDVVALFSQLLAGGVIRGIRLMASSQRNQYDGIYRQIVNKPFSNHEFHIDSNPLGIQTSWLTKEVESEPLVLEYKYTFQSLVEDIEKEEKDEKQINLVVAWTMGETAAMKYDVLSTLFLPNMQHRSFHGQTHKISSNGVHVFDAIILDELIDYINDPEGVQQHQEETYEHLY